MWTARTTNSVNCGWHFLSLTTRMPSIWALQANLKHSSALTVSSCFNFNSRSLCQIRVSQNIPGRYCFFPSNVRCKICCGGCRTSCLLAVCTLGLRFADAHPSLENRFHTERTKRSDVVWKQPLSPSASDIKTCTPPPKPTWLNTKGCESFLWFGLIEMGGSSVV